MKILYFLFLESKMMIFVKWGEISGSYIAMCKNRTSVIVEEGLLIN